jgi:mannosyltransferase
MLLEPTRSGTDSAAGAERPAWRLRSADLWLVGALTLLGAGLRFATIASQSYWLDESTTVHELHLSFGALLHAIRVNETTPPLYFALAWVWAKLFGTGEAGLRSLSAIAGVATIPLAYLCGRELVSRRSGLVAAALVTISPFMIWYSQEARSYMLLVAFCAASFLFFAKGWRAPSRRHLTWWAVFSALAILTHFFAGFLVAPEALLLLYRARSRACVVAAAAVALVQVVVVPLAVSDTTHPLNWIIAFPLSIRIQQVPVQFGLASLYQSSLVTSGLLAAAVLTAVLILLLVIGADRQELIGAGLAAAVAAFVIFVPLLLALVGSDYYLPRNLMPAWIPLAVVVGAACTASRARVAGAALAVVLLGAFVWAGIRINDNPQYQRPDWSGVAGALGTSPGTRAIVAYDGATAAGPLAVYLPDVPWGGTGQAPAPPAAAVKVAELDVVANQYLQSRRTLPPGVTLIGRRVVDGYLVQRFSLRSPVALTAAEITARAGALVGSDAAGSTVLIQNPPGTGTAAQA